MSLFTKKQEYQVEFYLIDAFEIYHFLPIYKYLESEGISCCFVAEPPKRNISKNWFDYDSAIKILKINHVNYKKKANYDAKAGFTTQDERFVHNYHNLKIQTCYGMSLEANPFSESDKTSIGFDYKLVHGQLGYDVCHKKYENLKMIKVGYPRYSKWGEGSVYQYDNTAKIEEIKKKNVENKPVLLYFPTWNTRSSIDGYYEEMMKLKDRFFIITKAHHCTFRLWREKERLEKITNLSDVLLEGNFSFKEAASLGELAVVDAISSSSTEVPYVNKDMKMVLVYSTEESENRFKEVIDEFAVCAKKPEELVDKVIATEERDEKYESRQKILAHMYEENAEIGLKELKRIICQV